MLLVVSSFVLCYFQRWRTLSSFPPLEHTYNLLWAHIYWFVVFHRSLVVPLLLWPRVELRVRLWQTVCSEGLNPTELFRFKETTSPSQPTLLHNDDNSCFTTGNDLYLATEAFCSTKTDFRWKYGFLHSGSLTLWWKSGQTRASGSSLAQPEGQSRPFLR